MLSKPWNLGYFPCHHCIQVEIKMTVLNGHYFDGMVTVWEGLSDSMVFSVSYSVVEATKLWK